jgi:hypothetical protein
MPNLSMSTQQGPLAGPTRRDLGRWLTVFLARQAARGQAGADGKLTLESPFLTAMWQASGGRLRAVSFRELPSGVEIALPPDGFSLLLEGGRTLKFSEMPLISVPTVSRIAGNPQAIRRAARHSGSELSATARDPETGATLKWRAILLDGSPYLRQELTIAPGAAGLPIREVVVWDCDLDGVRVVGTAKGSPAVAGRTFFAFEHPLSTTTVTGSHLRCSLSRTLPVHSGSTVEYSSAIGVTAEGQLRRGFLEYIEDQRAHPYRTFFHYNSWYDLGAHYDEAKVLDRVDAFGKELVEKRGVTLDSFLLDDGWDNPASLWSFHSGFPSGFTKVAAALRGIRAGLGVWLSPWGGYAKSKQERIRFGRQQGFEVQNGGFALSGPKYYRRFREVCRKMIAEYAVNQFKFDGTGNVNQVSPGSRFDSDFDAALALIGDLRQARPDLYVNLTTGTYPSPFWLRFADSIWRGGDDHSFAGVGSWRQRWITYRDADTYQHVVVAGPLFPLNSLMLHGIIYGTVAKNLETDPESDFRSEVRSYFGTGTQLQEMYISPQLLSPANWDDLAEAAQWSRKNAATLVDTHWVGGDPGKLEVYGWAAWSPEKGILTLRNPSDHAQTFAVDVDAAFELPKGAPAKFRAASPWTSDLDEKPVTLEAGTPFEIQLAPFQVRTLEAIPL